jgi:hypothetical protein
MGNKTLTDDNRRTRTAAFVAEVLEKKMKSLSALMLLCFMLLSSGCAVFMAAKQPDKKNVELFKIGTPRSMLLAEFGMPTVSEIKDGKKHEIYKFVQGYSAGAKAGRALFHGAADVMTLGLWEIVGTPAEAVFNGDEMAYEVSYDEASRVDEVIALKK